MIHEVRYIYLLSSASYLSIHILYFVFDSAIMMSAFGIMFKLLRTTVFINLLFTKLTCMYIHIHIHIYIYIVFYSFFIILRKNLTTLIQNRHILMRTAVLYIYIIYYILYI